MRVAILHPELGLGGAERVMVDAASSLHDLGHKVTLFTARMDPQRHFDELEQAGFELRVEDTAIPGQLLQRARAPLSILRMRALATHIDSREFDVLLCDVVSHVVPFIKRRTGLPVVFYCHYPDRLLTQMSGPIYRLYRRPIDRSEEQGLRAACRVLVNSRFTQAALAQAFSKGPPIEASVLYPGVLCEPTCPRKPTPSEREPAFLAIGRIAPEKRFELAVDALAELSRALGANASPTLTIAGGYDANLSEQVRTLSMLRARAAQGGVAEQVRFELSCSQQALEEMLFRATALLHTADAEHFGMVPLEAMAAATPVIVTDAGGPRETVVDGETGFRVAADSHAFARCMLELLDDPARAERMGRAGYERVARLFSRDAFGAGLEAVLHSAVIEFKRSA